MQTPPGALFNSTTTTIPSGDIDNTTSFPGALTVNAKEGLRIGGTSPFLSDLGVVQPMPFSQSELDDLFANSLYYDGTKFGIQDIVNTLATARMGFSFQQAKVFQLMFEREPVIASHLMTRTNAVLGLPWDITWDEADPNGEAKAKAVKKMLEKAGLRTLLYRLQMGSLVFGYDGNIIGWNNSIVNTKINQFYHIDPSNIYYDIAGRLEMRGMTSEVRELVTPANCNKYVFHSMNPLPGIPSVGGLMRLLCFHWLFKHEIMKHMVRYIEKFGMPTIVAKLQDVDFNNNDRRQLIMNYIRRLGSDGAMLVNQGTAIDALQAQQNGSNAEYMQKIDYFDRVAAQVVLGQTATSGDGSGWSKGSAQAAVRQDILEADSLALMETINTQVIIPLEKYKYGTEGLQFAINFAPPEDTVKIAETLARVQPVISSMGKQFDSKEIEKRIGFKLKDLPKVSSPAIPAMPTMPAPVAPMGGAPMDNESALAAAMNQAPVTPPVGETQAVGGAAPQLPFPQAQGELPLSPTEPMSESLKSGYVAFADEENLGQPEETDAFGNPVSPELVNKQGYDPDWESIKGLLPSMQPSEARDVSGLAINRAMVQTPQLQNLSTSYVNPYQMAENAGRIASENAQAEDTTEEERGYYGNVKSIADAIKASNIAMPSETASDQSKYQGELSHLANRLSSMASAVNYNGGREEMKQDDPAKRKDYLSSVFDKQLGFIPKNILDSVDKNYIAQEKESFIKEAESRRGLDNDTLSNRVKGWTLSVPPEEKAMVANGTAGILWEAAKRGNESLITGVWQGVNVLSNKISFGLVGEAKTPEQFRQYRSQEEAVDALKSDSFFMNAGITIAGMATPVLGSIALAPFTGGTSLLIGNAAVFGLDGLGETYGNLKDAGVSDNIAFAGGLGTGVIDGALSTIQLGKFAPVLTKPISALTSEARAMLGKAISNAYARSISEAGSESMGKAINALGRFASMGYAPVSWALAPASVGVATVADKATEKLASNIPWIRSLRNIAINGTGVSSAVMRGTARLFADSVDAATLGAWQMLSNNIIEDVSKVSNDVINGTELGKDINLKQQAEDALYSIGSNLPSMIGMTVAGHGLSAASAAWQRNAGVAIRAKQQNETQKAAQNEFDAKLGEIKHPIEGATSEAFDTAIDAIRTAVPADSRLGIAARNNKLRFEIIDDPTKNQAEWSHDATKNQNVITFNLANIDSELAKAYNAAKANNKAWTAQDAFKTVGDYLAPLVGHEGFAHDYFYGKNSGLSRKDITSIEDFIKTQAGDPASYGFDKNKQRSYLEYYLKDSGVAVDRIGEIADLIQAGDNTEANKKLAVSGAKFNNKTATAEAFNKALSEEQVAAFVQKNWDSIVANRNTGKFQVFDKIVGKMQSKFLTTYAHAVESLCKAIDPTGKYNATQLREWAALKLMGYTFKGFFNPGQTAASQQAAQATQTRPAIEVADSNAISKIDGVLSSLKMPSYLREPLTRRIASIPAKEVLNRQMLDQELAEYGLTVDSIREKAGLEPLAKSPVTFDEEKAYIDAAQTNNEAEAKRILDSISKRLGVEIAGNVIERDANGKLIPPSQRIAEAKAIAKPSISDEGKIGVKTLRDLVSEMRRARTAIEDAARSTTNQENITAQGEELRKNLIDNGVGQYEAVRIIDEFNNRFAKSTDTNIDDRIRKFNNWLGRNIPQLRTYTDREVTRMVNGAIEKSQGKIVANGIMSQEDAKNMALDYANELFGDNPEALAKVKDAMLAIEPSKKQDITAQEWADLYFNRAVNAIHDINGAMARRDVRAINALPKTLHLNIDANTGMIVDNPDIGMLLDTMRSLYHGSDMADTIKILSDMFEAPSITINDVAKGIADLAKQPQLEKELQTILSQSGKSAGLNRWQMENIKLKLANAKDVPNLLGFTADTLRDMELQTLRQAKDAKLAASKKAFDKLNGLAKAIGKRPISMDLTPEEIAAYGQANYNIISMSDRYAMTPKDSVARQMLPMMSGKDVINMALNESYNNPRTGGIIIAELLGKLGVKVKVDDVIGLLNSDDSSAVIDAIKKTYNVDANIQATPPGEGTPQRIKYDNLLARQSRCENIRKQIDLLEEEYQKMLAASPNGGNTIVGKSEELQANQARKAELCEQMKEFYTQVVSEMDISGIDKFLEDASAAISGVRNVTETLKASQNNMEAKKFGAITQNVKSLTDESAYNRSTDKLTFIDKAFGSLDRWFASNVRVIEMLGFFDGYAEGDGSMNKEFVQPLVEAYGKYSAKKNDYALALVRLGGLHEVDRKLIASDAKVIDVSKYNIPGLKEGKLSLDFAMKVYACSGDPDGLMNLLYTFRDYSKSDWKPADALKHVNAITNELNAYDGGKYIKYVDDIKTRLIKDVMWGDVDDLYFKRFGVHLANIPGYFTIRGLKDQGDPFLLQDIQGRETARRRMMKTTSTTDRTGKHTSFDLDRTQSFTNDVEVLMDESARYHIAPVMDKLSRLILDKDFQQACYARGEACNNMFRELQTYVNDVMNPQKTPWAMQVLRNMASASMLAFKPLIWFTQLTSVPAGLRDLSVSELLKYSADGEALRNMINGDSIYKDSTFMAGRAASNEADIRTRVNNPSYFKSLYSDSSIARLAASLNYKIDYMTSDFAKFVTSPIGVVDQACANYVYTVQYKAGMARELNAFKGTPSEAELAEMKDRAIKRANALVAQTQQMSDPLFSSRMFRSTNVLGQVTRAFTLFMTPLSQINNAAFVDIYKVYKANTGIGIADFSKMVGRQLDDSMMSTLTIGERTQILSGILLTTLITPWATALVQHASVPSTEDVAKAMVQQGTGAVPIWGSMIDSALEACISKYGALHGEGSTEFNQNMRTLKNGISVPAVEIIGDTVNDLLKVAITGDPSGSAGRNLLNTWTFGVNKMFSPYEWNRKNSNVSKYGWTYYIASPYKKRESVYHPISMGLYTSNDKLDALAIEWNQRNPGTTTEIRFENPDNKWGHGAFSFVLNDDEYFTYWKTVDQVFYANPAIKYIIANVDHLSANSRNIIAKVYAESKAKVKQMMIAPLAFKHKDDVYKEGASVGWLMQTIGVGYNPTEQQKMVDALAAANPKIAKALSTVKPETEERFTDIEDACNMLAFADGRILSSLPSDIQKWIMSVVTLDNQLDAITKQLQEAKEAVAPTLQQAPVIIPQMNKTLMWNPPSKRLTLVKDKMMNAIMSLGHDRLQAAKIVTEGGNVRVTNGFVKVLDTHKQKNFQPTTAAPVAPQLQTQQAPVAMANTTAPARQQMAPFD